MGKKCAAVIITIIIKNNDDDDEDNRYHNCIPDEKVCLCDYFYLNKLKKMPFTFNIGYIYFQNETWKLISLKTLQAINKL